MGEQGWRRQSILQKTPKMKLRILRILRIRCQYYDRQQQHQLCFSSWQTRRNRGGKGGIRCWKWNRGEVREMLIIWHTCSEHDLYRWTRKKKRRRRKRSRKAFLGGSQIITDLHLVSLFLPLVRSSVGAVYNLLFPPKSTEKKNNYHVCERARKKKYSSLVSFPGKLLLFVFFFLVDFFFLAYKLFVQFFLSSFNNKRCCCCCGNKQLLHLLLWIRPCRSKSELGLLCRIKNEYFVGISRGPAHRVISPRSALLCAALLADGSNQSDEFVLIYSFVLRLMMMSFSFFFALLENSTRTGRGPTTWSR